MNRNVDKYLNRYFSFMVKGSTQNITPNIKLSANNQLLTKIYFKPYPLRGTESGGCTTFIIDQAWH